MSSETVTKLLPCPFCHEEDRLGYRNLADARAGEEEKNVVACHSCGAQGPCSYQPKSEAAQRWNRRFAAADRDRRFAEVVRREYDEFQVGITDDRKTMSVLMAELIQHVSVEHRRIYGTSCTAGAKEK